MRKKISSLLSVLLLLLLATWVGLSFVRTMYNFTKVYTEEAAWIGKSDEQKRAMQFGQLHFFLRFVEQNTRKGSQILLFTDDLKAHYLGRYYLYPTKIIGEHEAHIWKPKKDYYDYILIFPATEELKKKAFNESLISTYKKIATYKTESGRVAELYKK